MGKVMVNFRMDEDLKKIFEEYCGNIGMSLGTAFTIFAKKVIRDGKIPFELDGDPFYSRENIDRLTKSIQSLEAGKLRLTPHELIEVEGNE